jgi:hypothetical protein
MKNIFPTVALLWAAFTVTAPAADINFINNPFAGSTALATPGRQVNGLGEQTLPQFNLLTDRFVFNTNAFPNITALAFVNSTALNLPTSGFNVIVLQDSDNDNNPATAFNAGTAATLIANQLTADSPGFFIYFNSSLNLNRLVYSTNLNSADADLAILARISSPNGQTAISALPQFSAANFATSDVPEPSTFALGAAGLALAYWRARKQ